MGTINEKITEEDIDMFKFLDCTPETVTDEDEKTLEAYEDEGQYPPRFHLRFENTTHEATNKSCPVTITLTGFVPDSDSDPADSFSPNISITTDLEETFSNSGENINNDSEEKDPFLIELMPYIEPILYDDRQTYYQFGTQLGLTIDQLTQLEYKFPDTGRHIMQMLLKWRDSSQQSVSHHEISKALNASGYPILSVILENRFSIKKEMEAAAPRRQYGGFAVITDSKPLNGCQIIAEKFKQLPQGHDILQQQPNDAELNRTVFPFIASKWRVLAKEVGFDGPTVDAIKMDNHDNCSECINEVFNRWRRRTSPPFTWDTVLSVIYSDTVRGYKAGEHVYQHLMHTHQKHRKGPNPDYIVN